MSSLTGATTFGSHFIAYLDPDNAAYRVYGTNESRIVKAGKGHIAKYPEVYGDAAAWKGSTVLLTKGQSGHYTIAAILELLGLDISDIKVVDIEQNQIPAIFASGTGDIMVAGNPNWNEFAANPSKYTKVASLDMLYPSYDNIATIMATDKTIKNKSDAVYGFVKGLIRAENELSKDENLYKEWMYKWQSEYNVNVSREAAYADCAFYKLATYDFLEEMFSGDPGKSIIENTFLGFAKFMVKNEQMKQETFDKMNISDIILREYTLKAVAELRKEHP
jgi:ABC-type nitrate/sulfonate/bicarbonate transport system substrate-binding protein